MREMAELSAKAEEREEKLRKMAVELEDVKKENARMRQVNFELAARIKAAKKAVPDTAAAGFADKKKALLDKFSGDSSPATLLEIRELFLGAKKFDEAVRTFRQLLIEPKNQKFMPAVCLLVGEFYNLAGRTEEASFYLANPLIREDSFAQRLLDKIDIEVPSKN